MKIKPKYILFSLTLLGLLFWWCFPKPLFHDPYSTVLLAENEQLLAGKIASDGQWRFPAVDSVPENLEQAIIHFEDEYFFYHLGVNPVSTVRALWNNIREGKITSGGSTISMQVIRLSRKNKRRTYTEKLLEMYLAFRLEMQYSKVEILNMYVSHAPYGGNVVGIEAAAWRYFNRPIYNLSWAEAALLAVLPNSPSMLHLSRNRSLLQAKRDGLLKKLWVKGVVDETTYSLAKMESLPTAPNAIPRLGYHLMTFAEKEGESQKKIGSTIDYYLQQQIDEKVNRYSRLLSQNQVHNACAILVEIATGKVKAYVGNSSLKSTRAPYVDLVQSARSSGSILKPFLYAQAIADGQIHPSTLLRDVPITIGKYAPRNFDKQYDGVVRADMSLSRSLNIPATLLLRDYGLIKFHEDLRMLGMSTINRSVDNYGLTLILGGAEVSLWDLANAYTTQAQNLLSSKKEAKGILAWRTQERFSKLSINAGAWYQTSEALTNVQRPDLEQSWKRFSSSRKIAWKTGTSHGFKDAWAIGYNSQYLVGVWVGNADGEGRPGLTGTSTAAPLMFDIFQLLPKSAWFETPHGDLKAMDLCEESGCLPGLYCPTISVEAVRNTKHYTTCNRHQYIVTNSKGERVNKACEPGEIVYDTAFVLDPVAAYFYAKQNTTYKGLPPFSENCGGSDRAQMAIIYPNEGAEIIVPVNLSGEKEKVQFKATHTQQDATLYWHLDAEFIGQTQGVHQLALNIESGQHLLLITDEEGVTKSLTFEVHN
jgi:penicillin-binding protein 1C